MTEALKPGQKFPTPTPGVGDRVFYETLYRQRPDSIMAQEWCISYGILPNDEAEHIWQKLQERKRRLKMGGGDLTPPPAAKKKSKGVKSSKAIKEEGYDPELQISAGDAIGRASL